MLGICAALALALHFIRDLNLLLITRSLVLAVSESSRFGDAANAYWDEAPRRAIDTVCKVLHQAQQRGEVYLDDAALVARQFVAMLRGDLHLQILFGLRNCPTPNEIHRSVSSAVDVLLCGARVHSSSESAIEAQRPVARLAVPGVQRRHID